jgi:hypothetical protein
VGVERKAVDQGSGGLEDSRRGPREVQRAGNDVHRPETDVEVVVVMEDGHSHEKKSTTSPFVGLVVALGPQLVEVVEVVVDGRTREKKSMRSPFVGLVVALGR